MTAGFISAPYLVQAEAGAAGPPPTFVSASVGAGTTGSGTFTLPAGHVSDDILLLFVETSPVDAAPSAPAGYAEVTASPQADTGGLSADQTRLSVFWKRDGGSEVGPSLPDIGNHFIGNMMCIRGCTTSGNPWDTTAGGIGTGAQTSLTLPALTTSAGNRLIVNVVSTSFLGVGTTEFSGWTNGNLASITERVDFTVAAGTGGGIGASTGVLASAGSTGQTTVTAANSERHAYLTIALKP